MPTDPYAARERHHNEGHGRRLTQAFEALEGFPVMAESRHRLLTLFGNGNAALSDVVNAIEGDVAVAIAVLRLANQIDGPRRGRVDSAVLGLEVLTPQTVQAIVSRARTYDFFERTPVWQGIPERFRLHGIATQSAADRIAREIGYAGRDSLMMTALLHDIGKLVLVHAYAGYPRQVHGDARTPEDRLAAERRELGVDHALVGGVLARRWGLPRSVAQVIETHHGPELEGEPAIVRLADMLAHYLMGAAVSPNELLKVSRQVGMDPQQLRSVMFDLPMPVLASRPRHTEPSPMSDREVDVLRQLAKGMVYKQIAAEMGLSTSTVRTHLHNVYKKLGAMDRAQAVLIATERGWL
ncbi:MAG TPA: HDOD domain-containing protein [Solirubrobacteraceae bacterium]|nr:HDOD domain-containing protein [Solirubrobacteraceae bacterium]